MGGMRYQAFFFTHLFGFKERSALRFEGVLMVRVVLEGGFERIGCAGSIGS